jgi:hypothetical protein
MRQQNAKEFLMKRMVLAAALVVLVLGATRTPAAENR